MHSSQQLAVAVLFASFVASAPLEAILPRNAATFEVKQVKNPTFKNFVASGPAVYAKALSKFKAPLNSDLAAIVTAAAATGKVPGSSIIVLADD
jgi:hypothetical protein